jgi:hypothetical protein
VTDNVGVSQVTWSNSLGGSGTATLSPGTWSVSSIALQLGDNIITVTASDAAGNLSTATVTITRITALAAWQAQYFNAGELADPNISGPNADPNKNGIKNLLEYALGGVPNGSAGSMGILPQLGRSAGNTLQLTFTRYLDRTDITLTVQGADLPSGTWTDLARSTGGAPFVVLAPGATAPETGTGNARGVTVTDLYQVTDHAHPQRFLKLQVTQ